LNVSYKGYWNRLKGRIQMKLQNKVAVITGGSRGIGFATASKFLEEGASVIICASREETAIKGVDKLKELHPGSVVEGIWPAVADYEAVQKAFDEIIKKYGKIDILVNNAGISEDTPIEDYTPELFDKVMNLNVKALFNCSKAVVPGMTENGGGVILNTSSMVSKYGQAKGLAYPTSKFAVNGMTLSLARELAPKGIRVNAVAPGVTETDMMRNVPEQYIKPLIASIPLQRLGQPEDIANAYAFLASEDASYISGQIIGVDGLARA
jgi:3-oxoacyl-[acyl-carrier protein] reductase/7-alpha-hydroxysteroid dehydrogenase